MPQMIRRLGMADRRLALQQGMSDFAACRTDVVFLGLAYALAGIVLVHLTVGHDLLPLVFPLASGFAILGPVAAVGLYEMSRRPERGLETAWADRFAVVASPAFGAIMVLGLYVLALFLAPLVAPFRVYKTPHGPDPPETAQNRN